MRNLFKVVIMLMISLSLANYSQAQSTTRPWLVGAGINSVDFHAPNNMGDYFKTQYWNTVPAISHLALSRCLNSSLALDLQAGGSRITVDSGGNEVGGKGFVD